MHTWLPRQITYLTTLFLSTLLFCTISVTIVFAEQQTALIKRVLDEMRRWLFQPEVPAEIWYELLWNLAPAAQQQVPSVELKTAEEFLLHIANRSSSDSDRPLTPNALAWVGRSNQRLTESARNNSSLKAAIRRLEIAQDHWQSGVVEDENQVEQQSL